MSNQSSKTLSFILRHKPEQFGLKMDKQGWVEVQPLVDALVINIATLVGIVNEDKKGRYEFNADGTKVRATQGHSIPVELDLVRITTYADKAYHGTATRNLDSILSEGLKPGSRQYVHMVSNFAHANDVGTRHGVPAVLGVDIQGMIDAGIPVYQSANKYLLADTVPPEFLTVIKGAK